jgi:hypothetical protein
MHAGKHSYQEVTLPHPVYWLVSDNKERIRFTAELSQSYTQAGFRMEARKVQLIWILGAIKIRNVINKPFKILKTAKFPLKVTTVYLTGLRMFYATPYILRCVHDVYLILKLLLHNIIYVISSLSWPPLWSSGQSSWLQIRRPGFDFRHYQKKNVVGLERGALSLVSTNWGATW